MLGQGTMVYMISIFTSGLNKVMENCFTRDRYFFRSSRLISMFLKNNAVEKKRTAAILTFSEVFDPDTVAALRSAGATNSLASCWRFS